MTEWEEAQQWENSWWGNCCNTFAEEDKQRVYMDRMGMPHFAYYGKMPVWDFMGKTVLDVGGGPCSVLLKAINLGGGVVVDPCPYPEWVTMRYQAAGVTLRRQRGEDIDDPPGTYDVGLCYNVNQHLEDPEKLIYNMRRCCKLIRLFEWIDVPTSPGHIQTLREDELNRWLGGRGYTETIYDTRAYYGVFVGGVS